jgi:dipeptidyl-peptidase-4
MNVQWVPNVVNGSSDGLYITSDAAKSLIFRNIADNTTDTFVDAAALGLDYYDYAIQPSQENVLFSANYTKGYRHSHLADYYVFNRASGSLRPLVAEQSGDVQYAAWSPEGDVIAFVRGNDLYIWSEGQVRRVTEDGGPDVFNGVPDWVYEEGSFLTFAFSSWPPTLFFRGLKVGAQKSSETDSPSGSRPMESTSRSCG